MLKIKAENSLLLLLIASVGIVFFPFLGVKELGLQEDNLLDLARQFASSGVSSVFDENGTDFPKNFYAYLVSIILNTFDFSESVAVRLPAAVIMALLTLGMFRFRGVDEKMSKAFLASLLFMSSYSVGALAFNANVVPVIALALVCALSAIYHWVKLPTKTKFYIAILATSCTAIFMGVMGPIIVLAVGLCFMIIQENHGWQRFVVLALIPVIAVALAYGTLIFVTNDEKSAANVLGIQQITASMSQYNNWKLFLGQIFFSIFPWSIPIAVAILWIVTHPAWLKSNFLALTLFKQFGVIVFIIGIPSFVMFNRLSVIMLLAAVYFNMPIISSFLLSQIHNHSVTWKVTGSFFSAIIAAGVAVYVCALYGVDMSAFGIVFAAQPQWGVVNVAIMSGIVVCLYHLWRSRRLIKFNNRYLYNIVVLYILAQMLYRGYVVPLQ